MGTQERHTGHECDPGKVSLLFIVCSLLNHISEEWKLQREPKNLHLHVFHPQREHRALKHHKSLLFFSFVYCIFCSIPHLNECLWTYELSLREQLNNSPPPQRFTFVSELTDSFPLPLFGLGVIAVSIQKYQFKTNTRTLVQPQSLTASDPLLVQNYSIGNYWNSISLLGKSEPLKNKHVFCVSVNSLYRGCFFSESLH